MQCHACGTNLPDHAKFCAKCGQKLTPRSAQSAAPGAPAAPAAPAGPAPAQRPTVIEVSGMAPAGPEADPFGGLPEAGPDEASSGIPGGDAQEETDPFADDQTVVAAAHEFVHPQPATEGPSSPQAAQGPKPAQPQPPAPAQPVAEQDSHAGSEPDKAETERLLVGKNHAGFAAAFDKFRSSGGAFSATWNWPAFLFGMWWYLYRKLYVWMAIDVAAVIVLMIMTGVFPPLGILLIGWAVARGLLSNHVYYKFILRRMETAKHNYASERHKWEHLGGYRAYLSDIGGTVHPLVLAIPAVVMFFGTAIIGIIAAIAIPNFIKFQSKAQQIQAQNGLTSLAAAQDDYYAKYGEYAGSFEYLYFDPPAGPDGETLYCFYLSENDALPGGCDNYTIVDGYEAWATADEYVALAIGNIDSDDTLDVWAVDDTGEVYQLQDDLDD